MKGPRNISKSLVVVIFILMTWSLVGCAQSPENCLTLSRAEISEEGTYAESDQFPFQYPLDELKSYEESVSAGFCAHGGERFGPSGKYHAAEDFLRPAGTPVYAMADGEVSFSGTMRGYGWLIIIDHPQVNLYSLYGHLSPSRWRMQSGTVERGDLIGYLGDGDENGGSEECPLRPHLHFGVRAGQRADYPGRGEWRWMAGWIRLCPQEIGWLQPSVIISQQETLVGGFQAPKSGFVSKWGVDLLFSGIYLFGGICMLIYAIRGDKPQVLIFSGVVFFVAGCYIYHDGWKLSYLLFAMSGMFITIAIYGLVRRLKTTSVLTST